MPFWHINKINMSICHIIKVIRLKRLNSYKMYLNLIIVTIKEG